MVKRLLFSILLLLCSIKANALDYLTQYDKLKTSFETKNNLNFGINISYTMQKISSNTVSRNIITPYLTKDILNSNLGKTLLNFSANFVRFPQKAPLDVAPKYHIATLFNNYDTNYNELYELYFSHTFNQKYNFITLGLGQIPISKFDCPIASNLQRYYFLNSALAQNTTFTYPTAGIGAFTELKLNNNTSLSFGAIDATNPLANSIHFKSFDKYSSFLSLNYTPKFKNKYHGSYSLLIYDKPSVKKSPFSSQGWSLYLTQDISSKHSIFFRLNGATGQYPIINKSYSLGFLYDNPFNRNNSDQFAVAYSTNRINNTTSKEHILETYYDYKLNSNVSIRPDIQLYINHKYKENSPLAIFSVSLNLDL